MTLLLLLITSHMSPLHHVKWHSPPKFFNLRASIGIALKLQCPGLILKLQLHNLHPRGWWLLTLFFVAHFPLSTLNDILRRASSLSFNRFGGFKTAMSSCSQNAASILTDCQPLTLEFDDYLPFSIAHISSSTTLMLFFSTELLEVQCPPARLM